MTRSRLPKEIEKPYPYKGSRYSRHFGIYSVALHKKPLELTGVVVFSNPI